MASNKPIIICGTGRSGTSIFNKLLNLHPEIFSFRWESQIFSGFPNLSVITHKGYNIELLEGFRKRLFGHLFKRRVRPTTPTAYDAGLYEIIELEDLERAFEEFVSGLARAKNRKENYAAARGFAEAIFMPSAKEIGAMRWAEKTPRNLLFADKIQDILGDCYFINMVRDGRDVVSSILDRGFWPVGKAKFHPLTAKIGGEINIENAAYYWSNLIKFTDEMRAKIGPDRWLDVHLEEISTDPQSNWERILDFVDASWSDAVLDYDSVILKRKPKGELPWGTKAHKGRWMTDMTVEQQAVFNNIAGKELQKLGYE